MSTSGCGELLDIGIKVIHEDRLMVGHHPLPGTEHLVFNLMIVLGKMLLDPPTLAIPAPMIGAWSGGDDDVVTPEHVFDHPEDFSTILHPFEVGPEVLVYGSPELLDRNSHDDLNIILAEMISVEFFDWCFDTVDF